MVELESGFFRYNSWSFTRHRIWNRCKRQYYYDYIVSYLKPPAPVDANKIRSLKAYNSRFVLQGQIVHDILNEQIKLHCEKKPMDPTGAKSAYSRKIARYKTMAEEMLTEYRHGESVKEAFFTAIEESGKSCLNMFFESIWTDYQDRECLRHEEFDTFRIGDTEVTVKVDFVSKDNNGNIVITDWKTGGESDEYETELQMASYVIWAMQYYHKNPDEIKSELVFLKTGKTHPYAFFEDQLRDVEEKIKTDFEEMNTSYEYEDFPARPVPRECLSCRFAKVCPEADVVSK